MALTHVVDTSVLTRLGQASVRRVVEPLLNAGQIGRVDISDLEIGFSARNASEWDRLMTALRVFTSLQVDPSHFTRAGQVQRVLASLGHRGRKIPDLLIAAVAEDAGCIVLHYDQDFDLISEATGQPCQWAVPRGSID